MKTPGRHLLLITALLFICSLSSAVWAQNNCKFPGKRSQLFMDQSMDQRDDARLKCLKQKISVIKVPECLEIAKAMEYSVNAEEARLLCLYDLKKQPTLKECFTISKAMEYPDSGDEARWECIRKYNRVISIKQCNQLGKNMSYPGNSERAKAYCENELP